MLCRGLDVDGFGVLGGEGLGSQSPRKGKT